MRHATGQAVKRNGRPCIGLTRLCSVQDIRHVTLIAVELVTILLFSDLRNFVHEIRVKALMVMVFFFSVTSQIMHILSDSLALNNIVCDLFSFIKIILCVAQCCLSSDLTDNSYQHCCVNLILRVSCAISSLLLTRMDMQKSTYMF